MIFNDYEIRELSTIDLINAKNYFKELCPFFILICGEKKLGKKLCEYACLARYCLYKDNQTAFKNIFSALKAVQANDLDNIFNEYASCFNEKTKNTTEEFSFNENFKKQITEELW